MPLLFQKTIRPTARFAVWAIEENEPFFLEKLRLSPAEAFELKPIGGHRRLEFLAARLALSELSNANPRLETSKNEFGKPFWPILPTAHFSLSHSGKLAAAILYDSGPCGIDVQKTEAKMERLAPRFLSRRELAAFGPSLDGLHFCWGAKEAMYKAFGQKEVDYRLHLKVENWGTGRFRKAAETLDFDLFHEKIGDFMLVAALAAHR